LVYPVCAPVAAQMHAEYGGSPGDLLGSRGLLPSSPDGDGAATTQRYECDLRGISRSTGQGTSSPPPRVGGSAGVEAPFDGAVEHQSGFESAGMDAGSASGEEDVLAALGKRTTEIVL
jgi:hypothetical protein